MSFSGITDQPFFLGDKAVFLKDIKDTEDASEIKQLTGQLQQRILMERSLLNDVINPQIELLQELTRNLESANLEMHKRLQSSKQGPSILIDLKNGVQVLFTQFEFVSEETRIKFIAAKVFISSFPRLCYQGVENFNMTPKTREMLYEISRKVMGVVLIAGTIMFINLHRNRCFEQVV